jgi:serine/threonine-protein kinase
MTIAEAIDTGIAVAAALSVAHEGWIVHRDIKPENIMLRPTRVVKVLDFGVAALSGDGDRTDPLHRASLVGTLHYLSPEQVRGEAIIDTRSDIYSLGIVLYEMLASRPPFTGATSMDVLAAIVEQDPKPLPALVPEPLRELVMRALRKEHVRAAADRGRGARAARRDPPRSDPARPHNTRRVIVVFLLKNLAVLVLLLLTAACAGTLALGPREGLALRSALGLALCAHACFFLGVVGQLRGGPSSR